MSSKPKLTFGTKVEDAVGRFLLFCVIGVPICISLITLYIYYKPTGNQKLKLSSGTPEGTNYLVSQNLAKILKDQKTRFDLQVLSSAGSIENLDLLKKKKVDFAFVQSDMPEEAQIRTVLPMHPEILHILVRRDSSLKTFKDLENKKLHLGLKNSGSRHLALKLFKHFGMSFDESTLNQGDPKLAAEKLINKEIDAILFVAGFKPRLCRDLLSTGKVRLIGMEEEQQEGSIIDGFVLDHPFIEPYLIPAGCYTVSGDNNEPKQAIPTISVRSTLVTNKNTSTSLVFQLLTDIFKWKPSLIRTQASFASLSDEIDQDHLSYPLHPGADLFFNRERPGFWVKYSEVLSLILSAIIALIGFCTGLSSWLRKRRKEHLDNYFIEIDQRMNDIKIALDAGQSTQAIITSLFELKQRVIKDLVNERIESGEGFTTLMSLITECEKEAKVQSK